MIISDTVMFVIVGVFALIFSIESFDIPTHGMYVVESEVKADRDEVETVLRVGRLFAQIRVPAFFMISGALWIALGFMFGSANNCDFTYQQCYTGPLYNATTVTIKQYTYGLPLEALFIVLGGFFIMLFSVSIIGWFLAFVGDKRNPAKKVFGQT